MRKTIQFLSFLMIIFSTNAFIQIIKDGGARDSGLENLVSYSGPLNYLPLFWLGACISFFLFGKKKIQIQLLQSDIPFLILLALCFVSSGWAETPSYSLRTSTYIFVSYLLVKAHIKICGWRDTLKFLEVSFLFIILASILIAIAIPSYGVSAGFENSNKWQGVFDHKNALGNFCALAFVVYLWSWRNKRNPVVMTGTFLSGFLIIKSDSTTAFAIMLVALTFSGLLKIKFFRNIILKRRYLVPIFFILVSALILYASLDGLRIPIFEKDTSFSNRDAIWLYMLKKISSAPVFGYGLDQLSAFTLKNGDEFLESVGFLVGSAHNGFLTTVFDLGIVGLLTASWVLLRQISSQQYKQGLELTISYFILLALLNSFESRLVGFNIFFIMFLYIGSLTSDMTQAKRSQFHGLKPSGSKSRFSS